MSIENMTSNETPAPLKPTTDIVTVALRERYCQPEFAFFQEVGDSGSGSRVYADGVAINMWASRGYAITGFEVKVSRSDWLRELKQPEKSEPILTRCDYWYLVAPDEVYLPDEVPVSWGILSFKDGKLREKRKAPKLEPKPITRAFVAQMFRRAHTKDERDISARVARALEIDRAAMGRRVEEEAARRTRKLGERAEQWTNILKELGVNEWTPSEEIVAAVKVVMKSGICSTYAGISELSQRARRIADKLEEAEALRVQLAPPPSL